MADEEKEKAEKLAAAKKRFEQLKKEQQKKGKKGGKKKEDKAADGKAEDAPEDVPESAAVVAEGDDGPAVADGEGELLDPASVSQQSKQRSESFKQSWSARIEELEKENQTLREQAKDGASRLSKTEEELDGLREGSGDLAELRSRAKEAERLSTQLATVQRQLAQAQQQAAKPSRPRAGTASSPDVSEQLASKTATIESLELEISNLRNQTSTLESNLAERDASARDLTERLQTAETATTTAQQELDALKVSISFPSDDASASADPAALSTRITLLESDLRTAHSALGSAAARATSLEQKIDALTKLHRDAAAGAQAKDRELAELRAQLRRRDRASHVRDASDFELGEEETETGALQARIRALEAEAFDLRRGVWRDRRAELQPGMDEDGGGGGGAGGVPAYEDVDLNGPYSPLGGKERGGAGGGGGGGGYMARNHSTFQDVITSGINAFTGRPAREGAPPVTRDRKASLGLMSDDGGFDEEAYRLAQEEEAKRRVERVKEVKRGLEQWKGWRMDIADLRRDGGLVGRESGPVFEV